MIFGSKNEAGFLKWKWIQSLPIGTHFVTRRMKPREVGKIIAIQPNRAKKGVCKAEVISCVKHIHSATADLGSEARLENFLTFEGLVNYFRLRKEDINDSFRIELKKVV